MSHVYKFNWSSSNLIGLLCFSVQGGQRSEKLYLRESIQSLIRVKVEESSQNMYLMKV